MILDRLDLDTAMAEGIISGDQAARLRDLASRDRADEDTAIDFSQDTRDEPFRLLRGFRDVFIAIGIIIFAAGLTAVSWKVLEHYTFFEPSLDVAHPLAWIGIPVALAQCLVGLALAEIVTRRQRLPLSSLVISLTFSVWSSILFHACHFYFSDDAFREATMTKLTALALFGWGGAAGAFFGMALFYWRYRLPFALLPLAASIIAFSLMAIETVAGKDWFQDHIWILIGPCGALVFATAMWFDIRDRLRVTRLSECAFWLHVGAAPLLVHSLLFGSRSDSPDFVFIFAVMAVLSAIALLIDRRALLVSGLSYLTIAIVQLVSISDLFGGMTFAPTALMLGGLVLTLGLGWTSLRRRLLAVLPFDALKARLPPAAA